MKGAVRRIIATLVTRISPKATEPESSPASVTFSIHRVLA